MLGLNAIIPSLDLSAIIYHFEGSRKGRGRGMRITRDDIVKSKESNYFSKPNGFGHHLQSLKCGQYLAMIISCRRDSWYVGNLDSDFIKSSKRG